MKIQNAANVDQISKNLKSMISQSSSLVDDIESMTLDLELNKFFKPFLHPKPNMTDDWKITYMKALLEKLQTYTNDISSLRYVLVQVMVIVDDFMEKKKKKNENDLLAIRLCEDSLRQISACIVHDYYDDQHYANYWMYYFNILLRHLLTLYERNGFSLAMITIYQMLITTLKHQKSKKDRADEESRLKTSIEQGLENIPQNQLLDKLMSHRGIRQRTLRKEYDSRINHIKYLTDLQKLIRDATLPDGKLPELNLKEFKKRLEDASHSFPVIKFGKYSIIHESNGFYPHFHIPTSKKLDDLYEEYQKERQL